MEDTTIYFDTVIYHTYIKNLRLFFPFHKKEEKKEKKKKEKKWQLPLWLLLPVDLSLTSFYHIFSSMAIK